MENQRSRHWSMLGYLNLLTAFSILIVYGVVCGWVLYYLAQALSGSMMSIDADASAARFAALLNDVPTMTACTLASLAIAGGIIYGGVEKGIERAVILLMPLLFALLLLLVGFNTVVGGMPETLTYLFNPDFSKVSPSMALAAVGQAFFSIGVAMAGMMMFGAYLPKDISIGHSAVTIVAADTGIALLAGLVIFPMVFHNGLDPAGGAGLIFQTLPLAFAQMPGGQWVGVLFFLLLSVAAITSVVGLCEPLGAWLAERFDMNRHMASVVLTVTALLFGLVSVLSYNHWAEVMLFGRSLNALMDYVPNQIFLPLGGLLIAVFVGYFVKAEHCADELALRSTIMFRLWHQLMRWVVVPAVAVILLTGVAE